LHEVFQLRYQVYCLERGFERGMNGEEFDIHDDHAMHALLRTTDDGEVIGTIRVIGPKPGSAFPMQELVDPALLAGVPLHKSGEMSRMAVSKKRRRSDIDPVVLRMALWRAVVEMSAEMGLTHWLAVIERTSIRLHARTGLYFDAIGPLVSHHGIRQPMVGEIDKVLRQLHAERPLIWKYVTGDGQWCGEPQQALPLLAA
jgi:N-acyl-L-homoserine lactone synthetase